MKTILLFAVTSLVSLVALPLQALELWVTIAPQKYFVERVGGDEVSVQTLVEPGQSPEMYSPSAAQFAKLAKADAYVAMGLPVEHKVLPRIEASMPHVRLLQTSELAEAHDHGEGCVHGDQDPHVWMDPIAMIEFVGHVCGLLVELEPSKEAVFKANADRVIAELRKKDAELKEQLASFEGRAFYINHPALGHFAERYGLIQRSLEQAGSNPSARRIAELIKSARADSVGAVFTQPEFGRSSAVVLARALRVEMVELNPLAEDYIANLQLIADRLVSSFE